MKNFVFLLGAVALVSGCQQQQISHRASNASDTIAQDAARGSVCNGCDDYDQYAFRQIQRDMREAQEEWRRIHRDLHDDRPGWGRDGRDWGRPDRDFPGHPGGWPHSSLSMGTDLSASFAPLAAASRPKMSNSYRRSIRLVAKAYGISSASASRVVEAVNRAAVEDFGGIQELGISRQAFEFAAGRGGYLTAQELQVVAHRAGMSQERAATLIRALVGGR